jgi:hypothetical protein
VEYHLPPLQATQTPTDDDDGCSSPTAQDRQQLGEIACSLEDDG